MMRGGAIGGAGGRTWKGTVKRRPTRSEVMAAVIAVMLAAGIVALYWGDLASLVSQARFDRQIASIELVRDEIAQAGAGLSDAAASHAAALPRFEAYNEGLRASGGQQRPGDPFAADDSPGLFESAVVEGDLVGSVSVPSIGCSLPLYLGATAENMAKGAAVVAGTSLPLGQADSNCVIAAHRGSSRAALFRDIEGIQLGDAVIVATAWDLLTYRAVAFKVIDPDDVASVLIQPGRDLVTLLTCHPYGSNASRYLVICERVAADGEGADPVAVGGAETAADGSGDAGDGALADRPARAGSGVLRVERLMKGIATLALAAALAAIMGMRVRRWLRRRQGIFRPRRY